ncbi:MAG: hypothetical protein IKM00_05480, partial [Clostridia bacterium]|nr:hypothetical protein [Clostridia bacterium]
QRTARGATPLRQANCSALCAGVRAERVGFAVCNSHAHQQSSGTLVYFFLVLFLLKKEKVHRSPLIKGKKLIKNFVDRQRKILFFHKIF